MAPSRRAALWAICAAERACEVNPGPEMPRRASQGGASSCGPYFDLLHELPHRPRVEGVLANFQLQRSAEVGGALIDAVVFHAHLAQRAQGACDEGRIGPDGSGEHSHGLLHVADALLYSADLGKCLPK